VRKIYLAILFLTVLSMAFCLPLSAQEAYKAVGDPAALAEKLNARSSEISSITSIFVQEKHLEFLDETIVSKGHFWFRRENSLRWAYEEPFEYLIILHEGQFLIRDGEDVSSFDIESNAVFKEINDLIIGMVRGNVMDEERFVIGMKESSSHYLISLEPREAGMKGVISGMEVYFDKEDLMVSRIIMKENAADYTVIRFSERKTNEHISEAVFSTDY
jgi:outer membrane lipoprotein carrier protein